MAFVATTTLWAFEVGNLKYTIITDSTVEVSRYTAGHLGYKDCNIPAAVTYKGITYNVTSIGRNAFSGARLLSSITIPNSITSIGSGAFGGCLDLTYISIPNTVTNIGISAFGSCTSLTSATIGNSVTSIGDQAFQYCSSLTSITIPNSVTSIGAKAFDGCKVLKSVVWNAENCIDFSFSSYPFYNPQITSFTFGDNVKHVPAYLCCFMRLTSIIIPESVTSIGDGAFYGCSSLTSVTIPNSVTSIGNEAFYNCSSLTSITIPNSVTSIGDWAFYNCESLTKTNYTGDIAGWCNIEFVDSYANPMCYSHNFYINDQEIKDLVIPNTVGSIHNYAFYNCSSLTSITIPNSVTSIGDVAFSSCSSLTSVTIPNSVTSIGEWAFQVCHSLTSITIPNSVTSIGGRAFEDCRSLTSVTIPNSVTSIGDNAFYGCNIDSIILSASDIATFCQGNTNDLLRQQDITSPRKLLIKDVETKEIDIPNSVESIKPYAFYNCIDLNKVSLSNNSVKTIGNSAFIGCSGLTSVTIGNCVTSIGDDAFRDCSNLTSITIPNSVTSIGYCAFAGCTGLNRLDLGTGITNISNNAFNGCSKLYDIYCYAAEPPTAQESSFTNYNAILHIPCESQRLYILDVLFGEFKYIECIASDEVPTDDIVITPGSTDVTITWPTEEGADTYTIVIKKDGEVVCTLTFNAEGQLLNIAFAPGRDGNHPAQYAEQAGKGYRFTVTGLEEGVDYTYDITVKDASSKTIKSYAGEFTTGLYTAVDNITTDNANTQKLLRDGQLLILKDNKVYTLMGTEL